MHSSGVGAESGVHERIRQASAKGTSQGREYGEEV